MRLRSGRDEGLVRVIACIVARPLEQPTGVGFSRQTLPGDFKLLVALKRNGRMRIWAAAATCRPIQKQRYRVRRAT